MGLNCMFITCITFIACITFLNKLYSHCHVTEANLAHKSWCDPWFPSSESQSVRVSSFVFLSCPLHQLIPWLSSGSCLFCSRVFLETWSCRLECRSVDTCVTHFFWNLTMSLSSASLEQSSNFWWWILDETRSSSPKTASKLSPCLPLKSSNHTVVVYMSKVVAGGGWSSLSSVGRWLVWWWDQQEDLLVRKVG